MKRRRSSMIVAVVVAGGLTAVAAARQAQPANQPAPREEGRERNLKAYAELLRSDLRTQKVALVTELMQFSEAEDAAFWPVYREHELALSKLNDERLKLIETYAQVYTSLTDKQADDLIVKALDLEAQRTALKQKYYAKLKSVLSPRVAAKAVQIEHQIDLLVDLQVAASLPVVPAR